MACSVMDTELLLLREEAALLTIDISALLLASHSNSDTDFVSAFSSLLRLLGRGGPRRARDFLREVVPTCNKGSWVGLEVPMCRQPHGRQWAELASLCLPGQQMCLPAHLHYLSACPVVSRLCKDCNDKEGKLMSIRRSTSMQCKAGKILQEFNGVIQSSTQSLRTTVHPDNFPVMGALKMLMDSSLLPRVYWSLVSLKQSTLVGPSACTPTYTKRASSSGWSTCNMDWVRLPMPLMSLMTRPTLATL
ncbi:MAG: hypothetical protein FRX49_01112 [Trebouxia sp. A1-2]|nr:MAG: hypothetical protein FRX49_01112 [Trebouxia sp. A1-2]